MGEVRHYRKDGLGLCHKFALGSLAVFTFQGLEDASGTTRLHGFIHCTEMSSNRATLIRRVTGAIRPFHLSTSAGLLALADDVVDQPVRSTQTVL